MSVTALHYLLPEIVLIVAAVAIIMAGAFWDVPRLWRWVAAGAIAAAAIALAVARPAGSDLGSLRFDELGRFGRWLAVVFGALLLAVSSGLEVRAAAERIGSLLLTVAGLMLVSVANDLVLLFVALELISIPTYVLLYLGRRDAAAQESTMKYFFLSVFSSAIVLYGFSFLYGVAGSTDLTAVRAAIGGNKMPSPGLHGLASLALMTVFAGLCFRITAVPFHFYAPDVYQGNTHANSALLSVLPKAAGFVVMVRLMLMVVPFATPPLWVTVLVVAVATMTFGNVVALWQDNMRRMMAYSSIAQAGYMLLALAVGLVIDRGYSTWNSLSALAFYLTTYAIATIGVFAVLEHLGRADRSVDGVDELAGLATTRPAAAGVLAVCLFSLVGIPPMAGFWGKLLVFGGALSVDAATAARHYRWLFVGAAIVGVLNSAVAAAYYLRIIAVMYFRTPLATPRCEGRKAAWWGAVVCAVLVLGLGLYPGMLIEQTDQLREGLVSTDGNPQGDGPALVSGRERPPLQSAPRPKAAAAAEGFWINGLSFRHCDGNIED